MALRPKEPCFFWSLSISECSWVICTRIWELFIVLLFSSIPFLIFEYKKPPFLFLNGRNQWWGQPDQQQGRRIPPFSFESAFLMRTFLVSAFLPEITQQIHSLRARSVISPQVARAAGVEARPLLKSAGILCGAPEVGLRRSIFIISNYLFQISVNHLPAHTE